MTTNTASAPRFVISWVLRKLVGVFVAYVSVASLTRAISGGSTIGMVFYALLVAVGVYLFVNM
ncbi:hypothetical protein PNP85_07100 [Halobacterium salinarum]|uniref:hypothetical protein n=1 Tax=Halobacterium salinarum TaxID=2242 RepID=UPI0025576154|nr:hypothetical protein [Halobacterium salinarum]MDL0139268.1 hypothetical protein [Halobacterium salinarum]